MKLCEIMIENPNWWSRLYSFHTDDEGNLYHVKMTKFVTQNNDDANFVYQIFCIEFWVITLRIASYHKQAIR